MSDLMLDVDQAGELKAAFRRGDWTKQEIKRLSEGDTLAQFRKVLLGRAFITECEPTVPKPEPVLNTIIRVDRSAYPIYHDGTKEIMHPDLEGSGPSEYDLATVQLWLHDDQKSGAVVGHRIYDHLKQTRMLKTCLNLRDGEAIKKSGYEVFRKFFGNKVVYLCASVVLSYDGHLYVPHLMGNGRGVVVRWIRLNNDFCYRDPAARFAN